MGERDRMPIEELCDHPFIAEELITTPLSPLDIELFNNDMQQTDSKANKERNFSELSGQSSQYSTMTSRFEDTVIRDTDVILSTKGYRDQVRCLLNQLVEATNFTSAQFDMGNSMYFNKHYSGKDTTIRMDESDSQVT